MVMKTQSPEIKKRLSEELLAFFEAHKEEFPTPADFAKQYSEFFSDSTVYEWLNGRSFPIMPRKGILYAITKLPVLAEVDKRVLAYTLPSHVPLPKSNNVHTDTRPKPPSIIDEVAYRHIVTRSKLVDILPELLWYVTDEDATQETRRDLMDFVGDELFELFIQVVRSFSSEHAREEHLDSIAKLLREEGFYVTS